MPTVLKQKDSLLIGFIEKCTKYNNAEFVNDRETFDIADIWESELKLEAKKIFTLLPLNVFEESVFKELQGLSNSFKRIKITGSKNSINKPGSIGSISIKIRSMSLNGSQSEITEQTAKNFVYLQVKCLKIIVNGHKIKSFNESLLESFWKCLNEILTNVSDSSFDLTGEIKGIFKKLNEINQRWLLSKIVGLIKIENDIEKLKNISDIRLKLYPEDELEDSMNFIEKLTLMTTRSSNICGFLGDLLNNMRKDCENELIYPKLSESIKIIIERFNSYYLTNFKVTESQMKMLAAALCLSGKEMFLLRFDEIISYVLLRIRENIYSSDSLLIINELLDTYYNKYSDSWATILDRTESILIQIFPQGRKNVLGCEETVDRVIKILETVTKKLPRFCYNEVIKKLIKQCQGTGTSGTGFGQLENFPWDRANIALQIFLYLCSYTNNNITFSINNLVWKSEYSQVKIGDLELEQMSKDVTELIGTIFVKISKQYWQSHLNEFNFDLSRTKLLSFVKMLLKKYLILIESETVLNLMESNNFELSELAKKSFLNNPESFEESYEIIHRIGNMIFGQSFKIKTKTECYSKDNLVVYDFFKNSFDCNCKSIPEPPPEENEVLRGGIFYILESLTSWSQTKLSDPTRKLDSKEIELFGKVVDVYFRLLSSYEALIKTVYLEKQNDKNILLRSWSSLVGFKRNSKEIADFLVSLLEYSDERLRWRIIESFKYLPSNRLGEFMKLFERFRLTVSEDFVNLKRSRRNDKSKIEITRVYKNVLMSWNPQEMLSPMRMILRHVIELYYYVSKNELIDEFIWTLRGEFCGLMKEYLRIINLMPAGTRKTFLPLKFHLEVWLTIDEWIYSEGLTGTSENRDNQKLYYELFIDNFKGDLEELFVNFAFNLIAAVSSVDPTTVSVFIDNLLVKISSISRNNSDLKRKYVYNLLKSSLDGQWLHLLFTKLVEFIGNGLDDEDGRIQEGILMILKEDEDSFKGPSLELFKLMAKDDMPQSSLSDPEGVLQMFYTVSSSKLQRRILFKLKETFTTNSIKFNEKIIESLFELTGKLLETFPNTLRSLWTSIDSKYSNLIIFLLQKNLQKSQEDQIVSICELIFESIYNEKLKELWLRYSHPFSGVKKTFKYSPVEATLKLLKNSKDESCPKIRTLFKLFKNDTNDTICVEDCYELLKWAVQCPVNKISLSAWKELKKNCEIVTDDFVLDLLKETTRFLQHLVCPATLNYFDADLVKEVLEFFELYLISKGKDVNIEVRKEIFELSRVQLSAKDSVVFESACSIMKQCLQCDFDKTVYYELSRRSSISIDLLSMLLLGENDISYERYFCYLIAFLPYLFRFFEESLTLNPQNNPQSFDYSAELKYLKLLRSLNEKILIEEAEVDENGKLCLLELSEFYVSVEKLKKRNPIDFYKNLAILLSDKSIKMYTLKLIFANLEICEEWDQFLLYYFDNIRIQNEDLSGYNEGSFKLSIMMSTLPDDPIRQRVIDYLCKTSQLC